MLKLLFFAPCEKIITGLDGFSSLIAVMESLELNLGVDIPLDVLPNAMVPLKWSVITLWHREIDVGESEKYEQRIDMHRPDGERFAWNVHEFRFPNESYNFREIGELPAFPVGQPGKVLLRVYLRKAGDDSEWQEMGQFPIIVRHIHPEVTNAPSTTENAKVG